MSLATSNLTLSILLFIAVVSTPLANAQVPPPPFDDHATITGRVYFDACQNGRFDPGTNYPRNNPQVELTCTATGGGFPQCIVTLTDVTTFTNTDGMFSFTHLANTDESATRQDGGRRFVVWWNSTKVVSNTNGRASPSLVYKLPHHSPKERVNYNEIEAFTIDDSVVPNIVYWVDYIAYYSSKPDANTLNRGWLNASKMRLTNLQTFPLFTPQPGYRLLLLDMQLDPIHGRLYIGYLTRDEYIMTVRNTRTTGLEAIVTKPLGTVF
eukprot:jgi/Chlat1/588/Chrsp103S00946